MPSYFDSVAHKAPHKSKKVAYKKGGKVKAAKTLGNFVSSGAPIVKPTTARGSGAARRQLFRKNG
jgi:hypothetical protein